MKTLLVSMMRSTMDQGRIKRLVFLALFVAAFWSSLAASGGAQDISPQKIGEKLPNVSVPPGYFLEPLVKGLDFPTAIAFSRDTIGSARQELSQASFQRLNASTALEVSLRFYRLISCPQGN
jgi:hypothetical protein